ncbi:hypothetical protein [Sinorhizobium chiapasense]|uniref:Uncharacterized protein n=1 Tax=Sinorhizobium chiapasense TaxID=501572 RepID=A0ABZ2BAW8_9HYPH
MLTRLLARCLPTPSRHLTQEVEELRAELNALRAVVSIVLHHLPKDPELYSKLCEAERSFEWAKAHPRTIAEISDLRQTWEENDRLTAMW